MRYAFRILTAVVMCVAALFMGTLFTPHAVADTVQCSQKIVDTTRDQVLNKTSVQAAVDGVEKQGADVYVRAFQNTPGGNADAFWAQGLGECSNWRSPDGYPKANVVVVMFGMDRTSGIFFNSSKFPELDSSFRSILSNDMAPNFRSGEFTAGITSALNEIARQIDPNKPAGGTDYSGVLKIFLLILASVVGFAMLGTVVYFGRRFILDYRDNESDRKTAQMKAIRAKSRVEQMVAKVKDSSTMKLEFMVAVGNLPEQLAATRRKDLQVICSLFDEANAAYVRLVPDADSDPQKKFSTERYQSIQSDYEKIEIDMKNVGDRFARLINGMKDDEQQLSTPALTERLNKVAKTISQMEASRKEFASSFVTTEFDLDLRHLKTEFEKTRGLVGVNNQVWEAHLSLTGIEDQASSLQQTCRELEAAQQKIVSVREIVSAEIASRRSAIGELEHVDTAAAFRELDDVSLSERAVYLKLDSSRTHDEQVQEIDAFISRIKTAGSSAVTENKRIIAKKKEEAEEQERQSRARRTHSSYGSSSS